MSLSSLKVVEFAGLAPGPFAGLILADNGASVTRIDKPSSTNVDILCRGKRSIVINPKIPSGREALKKLIASADVLIDPYRPGVMERLGLGPEVFFGHENQRGLNERLIYARIVGFPRTGPHKDMAGHDINYLAMTGVMAMLPGTGKPYFPLNLLADFAGGGLICVLGILLSLIERGKTGRGQVVNADMVSGARYVATFPLLHALNPASLLFSGDRGKNLIDGGAPFYDTYICKDGGWMSVGCLEPQFFKEFVLQFLEALPRSFSLSDGWRPSIGSQENREDWPRLKEFLEKGFIMNTRGYWTEFFHGKDACVLPVLTPKEARALEAPGVPFPVAHPKIGESQHSTLEAFDLQPGKHTREVLHEIGLGETEWRQLAVDGALGEEERSSARVNHKL